MREMVGLNLIGKMKTKGIGKKIEKKIQVFNLNKIKIIICIRIINELSNTLTSKFQNKFFI